MKVEYKILHSQNKALINRVILREINFQRYGLLIEQYWFPNGLGVHHIHCVKNVCIRSLSGPRFPAFWLNTKISVNLRIQSECGKMRTKKTPYTDTFTQWFTCSNHNLNYLKFVRRAVNEWYITFKDFGYFYCRCKYILLINICTI